MRLDLISGKTERSDKGLQLGNLIKDTYGLMIKDLVDGKNDRLPSIEENTRTLSLIGEIRRQSGNQEKQ
jgi:hypothetical protein